MEYNTIITDFFEKIPGFKEYYDIHGDDLNIDLQYIVIIYLADYYFLGANESDKRIIEQLISEMIVSGDSELWDLVGAGFFESGIFDGSNIDEHYSRLGEIFSGLSEPAKQKIIAAPGFMDFNYDITPILAYSKKPSIK